MATEKKIVTMMRLLLKPFQNVENAGQQLLARSVETSVGVVLTMLGNLVGQKRGGITDDEIFRRYVRARIATNKSTMDGESILLVASLFLGAGIGHIIVKNVGDPGYEITIEGVVMADDLAQAFFTEFLRKATGVSIPINLITYDADDDLMFEFGTDGDGEASSTQGFAYDGTDPDLGGVYASAHA